MEIKGTAVKITPEFVQTKFPEKYTEWVESLPHESRTIINETILSNKWFDLMEAVIYPTQKVGEMFYDNNEELAAFELGQYSAEKALKGIYKVFVRISSPQFVMSRATSIFATYYNPAVIKIDHKADTSIRLKLEGFSFDNILIIKRIEGWIAKTLEIVAKKEIHTKIDINKTEEKLICYISADWAD